MNATTKDLKKLAQTYLRTQGFYSGEIDGIWGELTKQAFGRYMNHLKSHGMDIGDEQGISEDGTQTARSGVVVLDPGHGGSQKIGGSSPNNATSASGVLEKSMTLDMAKRIQRQLKQVANLAPGSQIEVHLTRTGDTNLGLSDRARVAEAKNADIFVSIHFNGFNGSARGTETFFLSEANGNVNEAEDRKLAERIQKSMFTAIRKMDPGARDRGIKNNKRLGVLNDVSLGNARGDHRTRACLVEIEFIDNPNVDKLLNTGADSSKARDTIATAIAEAIIDDLA